MTSVSWICDMFGWFVWEILSIDNHLSCLREKFGVYVVNLKKTFQIIAICTIYVVLFWAKL